MKVLVQRVNHAACVVDGKTIGEIGEGLLLYVGFRQGDDASSLPKMAKKVANLRIFEDKQGKMNLSVLDTSKAVLSISQFTLEAATKKGHRPSFTDALEPIQAEKLYDAFNRLLNQEGLSVETGSFQAMMQIHSINDGPVTLLLERRDKDDTKTY